MNAEDFHRRLRLLGQSNGDEFQAKFHYDRKQWHVSVFEPADGHGFIGGSGSTPEEAMQAAWSGVAGACEDWGYKLPEGIE